MCDATAMGITLFTRVEVKAPYEQEERIPGSSGSHLGIPSNRPRGIPGPGNGPKWSVETAAGGKVMGRALRRASESSGTPCLNISMEG